MRIVFVCGTSIPLRPMEERPLGGSESSLLIVAGELARRGAEVHVVGADAPHGSELAGVRLLDIAEVRRTGLPRADLLVSLNRRIRPETVERLGGARVRYAHWHQNDAYSPYAKHFADPAFGARVDRFVFVSHHQASAFQARFALGARRISVIANPVSPAFIGLFPGGSPVLAAKDPELLVYASAPNRGLEPLARGVLPRLRAARPGLRLEIYSGFQIDQGQSYGERDGTINTDFFEALLGECAKLPGVSVHRGLPKPALAARLKRAAMLCYPCSYRETSCIAALEAMAAGCQVSTSSLGGLPETTAGFGYITRVAPDQDWNEYCAAFADTTLLALSEREDDAATLEATLRRQIDHVHRHHSPSAIGGEWQRLLAAEIAAA